MLGCCRPERDLPDETRMNHGGQDSRTETTARAAPRLEARQAAANARQADSWARVREDSSGALACVMGVTRRLGSRGQWTTAGWTKTMALPIIFQGWPWICINNDASMNPACSVIIATPSPCSVRITEFTVVCVHGTLCKGTACWTRLWQ